MRAHGITVGWGQDCVLDPWYSLGTADMLDVAFMGLHVAQMTSPDDMRACFAMVTEENARILNLDGYGLRPGARASLVVLDAADPIEALRRRAPRRVVDRPRPRRRRGAPAPRAASRFPGRPATVTRRRGPGGVGEPVSVWRIDRTGTRRCAVHETPAPRDEEEGRHDAVQGADGRFLAGGGEVGALVAARDWSATPLGPIERWPPSCATPSRSCSAPRCRW